MAACIAPLIHEETANTGRIAEQMLRAIDDGDLTELESEISRLGTIRYGTSSGMEQEQFEILSAIAEDLRKQFSSCNRASENASSAEVDVHISLLRHLVKRSARGHARQWTT